MDLLTGAMGILGPKLLDLLEHEYNLQTGLRNEVRSLSEELEHIEAFLRKVADVPWYQLDEQVKVWARQVRDASYTMEDALDSFLVHVETREPNDQQSMLVRALRMIGDLFSKGKPRHDIAIVIQGINKQLQEVAERRARYRIDDSLARPVVPAIDPRLAAMYNQVSQLIGIDKSRRQVISMLSYQLCTNGVPDDDNKNIKKVSVVGVGGLGKTTLAKAVYEKLIRDFDCGAFVPVGRNPDLKRVFKDILLHLNKGYCMGNLNMSILDERHLIEEIQGFLKEKRYFIVIDDIWEQQSWKIIKLALVENDYGSRIITTTRNSKVAEEAGEVYKLQPLSHYHSKKLFYARIFGTEGKCVNAQPDGVSDNILKRCDGIPLAIITMASLLVGKPREVWSELCSNIGFGQKDNMYAENTMRILSFSYYDLPSHLRTCLLYLSAFPEDYIIKKEPLVWKWIAEGFVHKKQGNGLFELGERYFNDLINRSMIQAVESFDGTVEGCRVHDMVLDLIRSLSRHESFVTILGNDVEEGILSQNKVRRLARQKDDSEHITPQADYTEMSLVRSYIACKCSINPLVPLLSFKLLRVLAIEYCRFNKDGCHVENIGNLLYLRYFSLRDTDVYELPKQIGNLKFLQTLDIYQTAIKELPASIVQLKQLVCLTCDGFWGVIEKIPDGFRKLMSLEHLTIKIRDGYDDKDVSNFRRFVEELGSLRELRVLEIHFASSSVNESIQRYLVESLRNLPKVQHIKLELGSGGSVAANMALWDATGSVLPQHLSHLSLKTFKFSRLPPWINPSRFHYLSHLALRVVTMDEQDLKLLGSLTELRYLDLDGMTATVTVSKINAGDGFFQKLRWLRMPCSMVQFQHEEDSTFSFHMWNGIDRPLRFIRNSCSEWKRCSVPSATIMTNIEVLQTSVFVRALKDGNGDCGNIGLGYLTSLQKVEVFIQCQDATPTEVEEVDAMLRCAINSHPNHPTFERHRWYLCQMVTSVPWFKIKWKYNNIPREEEEEEEEVQDKDAQDKDKDKEDEDTTTRKRRRTRE